MAAYGIAHYDIHNYEMWSKYAQAVIPNVIAAGSKFLTATNEFTTLEGKPQQVVVVVEFASMDATKTRYESASYQAIKPLHTESTIGWVLIAPEFSLPTG